jgi:hypothetical protein
MQSIRVIETKKTPYINFDNQKGRIEITGFKSMPDVSTKFYRPMLDWVKEYIKSPNEGSTVVIFKLEYFNTSSGKCFVEMFKDLDQLASKGHPVYLQWYYEEDDEDMQQCADDWEVLLKNITIEKISYPSS